jgi:dihydrolipoamide dehydrogenase
MQKRDLIIIGGGPGGYVAAIRASQLGIKATLIEKGELGGTCLNVGCIPTKALLQSANLYNGVRAAAEFGVDAQGAAFDLGRIMQRKAAIVKRLTGGVGMLLKKNGVEVIKGEARFTGDGTIEVNGKAYSFDNAIIAAGSKPAVPPIPGVDGQNVLFSTDALSVDRIPESIAVIGGGVIAVEFASIFNSFGSRVTIIEMMPDILPLIDGELSRSLRKVLEGRGIAIHTGARVEAIREGAVFMSADGKTQEIACQKALVAVGRVPALSGLGLETTGIENTDKGISVNASMQTSVPNIYAIGDAVPSPQLAHVASKEGTVAAEHIAGEKVRMKYGCIPSCVYTSPEAASVGLTEEEAKARDIGYTVGRFPLMASGKAAVEGAGEGFVKVLADQDELILGVHIMAPHASEMIFQASLAMAMEATVEELVQAVYPHPTVSESVLEAALAVRGEAVHF